MAKFNKSIITLYDVSIVPDNPIVKDDGKTFYPYRVVQNGRNVIFKSIAFEPVDAGDFMIVQLEVSGNCSILNAIG